MKIIVIPTNLITSSFLSFLLHKNQNQESNFQQVGALVTRNA